MAIKLNVQRSTAPSSELVDNGYLYKDIGFDLQLRYTDNPELYKDAEIGDLRPLYDKLAVITSIKNILTTSPGEKLLNPTFGVDLRRYLFDTVSETRAYFIGVELYDGLTIQEPRIAIDRLDIVAIADEQEYDITLSISIPTLNIQDVSLRGVLNNEGYTFV